MTTKTSSEGKGNLEVFFILFNISSFQKKLWDTQRNMKMWPKHRGGKKQATETAFERAQIDSVDKAVQIAIINISKELN